MPENKKQIYKKKAPEKLVINEYTECPQRAK